MVMSSIESEGLNPSISSSLPIPELIRLIRYSFHDCDFNEVQNILAARERNMKFEMENLERDRDSVKEEVRLLERRQDLADLEKIKLEERLKRSDRECQELKERITRLSEDQNLYREREKRAEEQYVKLHEENSKMLNDKNKIIFELNEKINELKNEKLEIERAVGGYQESVKVSEVKLVQMEKEIEDLRVEKMAADQTMEEFRRMQLEADRSVEELRRRKLESEKEAKMNRKTMESLLPKVMQVEEMVAFVLKVNVEDLDKVVNLIKSSPAAHASAGKQCSGNGSTQSVGGAGAGADADADADTEVIISPGASSACNSPKSGSSGKGGTDLVRSSWSKEDEGGHTGQTSSGSECGCASPQAETNVNDDLAHESEGLQESSDRNSVQPSRTEDLASNDNVVEISPGAQSGHDFCRAENDRSEGETESKLRENSDAAVGSNGTQPVTEQSTPEIGFPNRAQSYSYLAAGNIIEILDSDDERNSDSSDCTSNVHVNNNEERVISPELPSSSQANKRERTVCSEDSLASSNPKRTKNTFESRDDNLPINGQKEINVSSGQQEALLPCISSSMSRTCKEKEVTPFTSRTPLQKLDSDIDGDSSDSEDESCTDSHLDKLVASCQNIGRKKWVFEADMLKAFQEDEELCMSAVCALYRQQIFAAKSTQYSDLCRIGGFSHVDALSGRALAEYLIDGDPELKLRKSVSEVRQHRPDVPSQCKRLATTYHEKLFEIYRNRDDPFFGRDP